MKKTIAVLILVSLCVFWGCAPRMAVKPDYDFSKVKRVAVLAFEGYGAEGIADIFVMELMKSGFDVVERHRLESLLKEQDLGTSGRLDPSTVKNIGRILGVDAVITGSVSQYLPAQKRIVYFSPGDTPVILPGLYVADRGDNYVVYLTDAEIGLSARMIDVETGSIVWVASDTYRGFTTETALQGVVFSLVDSLRSVFPKKKTK